MLTKYIPVMGCINKTFSRVRLTKKDTVKTCVKRPLKNRLNNGLNDKW